jgi:hypothetical protein
VLAFAGHEIESFEEIYINDEVATIDGSGNVTSPSRYSGLVTIKEHLGTSTQAADSSLVSAVSGWTGNHRLVYQKLVLSLRVRRYTTQGTQQLLGLTILPYA